MSNQTEFISAIAYKGILSTTTARDNEPITVDYAFVQDKDFNRKAFKAMQMGDGHYSKANVLHNSGYTVIGVPSEGVSVWADGTDMPVEMAQKFVEHIWLGYAVLLNNTDYDDDGAVTSYDFDLVKVGK